MHPNTTVHNCIKQILTDLKREIQNNTAVGHFNISLSMSDSTLKQKVNKETVDLNNTIDHTNLTDICRIFYQTTRENTFFSKTYRLFSGQITGQIAKQVLTNLRRNHIKCLFHPQSNETRNNLEKKTEIFTNMWKPYNTLLNNNSIKQEIKREFKKIYQMKMKAQLTKIFGMQPKK